MIFNMLYQVETTVDIFHGGLIAEGNRIADPIGLNSTHLDCSAAKLLLSF